MKMHGKLTAPDFFVRWHNASNHAAENIYCDSALKNNPIQSKAELRKAIATLHTATTHIEVSEVTWLEPTAIEFMPNRPGFCALISDTSSLIEYGYNKELARSTQLGQVLFILPGKSLRADMSPGAIRTVTCSFECEYAESILGPLVDLSYAQLLSSLDVRSALISAILLRLMHEALYPGLLSEAVTESFGHAMLVECAHWLLTDKHELNTGGRLSARHFSIIEEYLAGLSGAMPSVSELAVACGLSERYFSKLFREQIGCSVVQYIKSTQITKAKGYLLETDLPLKEISYRLGFSTPANFSSAFRAATGSTPGQFRKKLT